MKKKLTIKDLKKVKGGRANATKESFFAIEDDHSKSSAYTKESGVAGR